MQIRSTTSYLQRLSSTTPGRLPPEVAFVWWWTWSRVHPAPDRDRGDILQTVIITAAFAAAAILIVAIIVAKARTAANNIKTQ